MRSLGCASAQPTVIASIGLALGREVDRELLAQRADEAPVVEDQPTLRS
jgi:hypothetical protein